MHHAARLSRIGEKGDDVQASVFALSGAGVENILGQLKRKSARVLEEGEAP